MLTFLNHYFTMLIIQFNSLRMLELMLIMINNVIMQVT